MTIIRSRKYQINLLKELDQLIKNIPNFPYKHKQSIYFDDKNIRDLIYKKHTINYEVNLEENTIEILNIFNKNKPRES